MEKGEHRVRLRLQVGHQDQVCLGRERGRARTEPVSARREAGADSRTVVFVIEEKKHPRFERVDDDLVVTMNITLSQALLGPDGGGEISKEVNQLDGRRIPVTLPPGVSSWLGVNADGRSFNLDKSPRLQVKACRCPRLPVPRSRGIFWSNGMWCFPRRYRRRRSRS